MNSKPSQLRIVPARGVGNEPEHGQGDQITQLEHTVTVLGETVAGLEERASIAEARADLAEGRQVADAANARLRLDALEARNDAP